MYTLVPTLMILLVQDDCALLTNVGLVLPYNNHPTGRYGLGGPRAAASAVAAGRGLGGPRAAASAGAGPGLQIRKRTAHAEVRRFNVPMTQPHRVELLQSRQHRIGHL